MNIALRNKVLKNGKLSLFLDFYLPEAKQKRRKEFLKLYLFAEPKNKLERMNNKKVLELAESIRVKRLLALQHHIHDFSHLIANNLESSSMGILAYCDQLRNSRSEDTSVYRTWKGMRNYLATYLNNVDISLINISETWVQGFRDYLIAATETSDSSKPLSVNTVSIYFTRIKVLFNKAVKEKLLDKSPAFHIANIKMKETQREFLTLEELKKAINTPCKNPVLKKAFLFSCLTGLRISDIKKMIWKEVLYSDAQGWYVRFTQKKTQGVETLPISHQARELLGDATDIDELVFKGLSINGNMSLKIQHWLLAAGIQKKITFHCARHTFATLQLTLGTDIYTVSKLLGHKKVKTTQIYGKIIDARKVEAVNRIPDLNI